MGSGKGYLSSFLSLQYGLRVYGIDSSSTNTLGAQERNRKLKKFSRVYQKHSQAARARGESVRSPREESVEIKPGINGGDDVLYGGRAGVSQEEEEKALIGLSDVDLAAEKDSEPETDQLFLSALSVDAIHTPSPRVPPGRLTAEERERRKRENLERKAQNRTEGAGAVFSPLTSYVTAETELRELIGELEVRESEVPKKKKNVENRFTVSSAGADRRPLQRVAAEIPTAAPRITSPSQQLEFASSAACGCGANASSSINFTIDLSPPPSSLSSLSSLFFCSLLSPRAFLPPKIPGRHRGRPAHVWRLGSQHPEDVCG